MHVLFKATRSHASGISKFTLLVDPSIIFINIYSICLLYMLRRRKQNFNRTASISHFAIYSCCLLSWQMNVEKNHVHARVRVLFSFLVKTNFVVWVYNVFESASEAEKPLFNGFIYFNKS